MAALSFSDYLKSKAPVKEESKHNPDKEYDDFRRTFEIWAAKDGRLKHKIEITTKVQQKSLPAPMLSLLEYSIPLDAPSSVPLPSIDAFLSSYRDIEFVKESTTGKMESMEVHSIDQAITTPTVPHNTIISGVLRSSLNGGWIIDVLHIFIQEPISGFQAPSVAFCPREYVYDTSKFSIKHNLLPGVFVKVGLVNSGPQVQSRYGSEFEWEVTMRKRDINLAMRDRYHELGPIDESKVFFDFSALDSNMEPSYGSNTDENGGYSGFQGDTEPTRVTNRANILAMQHYFGIGDYLTLRLDSSDVSQSMKREQYADELRIKQEEIWAEDIAASGYRHFSQSNFLKALELFNQSLELNSQCINAMLGKAMVHGLDNDFDRSMRYVNQILEATLSPNHGLSHIKRETRDAIRVLQKLYRKWTDIHGSPDPSHRSSDDYRDRNDRERNDGYDHRGRNSAKTREFPLNVKFRHLLQFKLSEAHDEAYTPRKGSVQSPDGVKKGTWSEKRDLPAGRYDERHHARSPRRQDESYSRSTSAEERGDRGGRRRDFYEMRPHHVARQSDSLNHRLHDDHSRFRDDRSQENGYTRSSSSRRDDENGDRKRSFNGDRRPYPSDERDKPRYGDRPYDDRRSRNDNHELSRHDHHDYDSRRYGDREHDHRSTKRYDDKSRSSQSHHQDTYRQQYSPPRYGPPTSSYQDPRPSSYAPSNPNHQGPTRPLSSNLTMKSRTFQTTTMPHFQGHLGSMILDEDDNYLDRPSRTHKKRQRDSDEF